MNHQPSNNSLHSDAQPVYEKPQQRRNTGFEILSLLESEEDAQPEPPTKCMGRYTVNVARYCSVDIVF